MNFPVQSANGCIAKTGYGFSGEFIAQNNCGLYCNGEGGLTACKNDGFLNIGWVSVQKLVHCCDDFFQFAIQHGVAAIGF